MGLFQNLNNYKKHVGVSKRANKDLLINNASAASQIAIALQAM